MDANSKIFTIKYLIEEFTTIGIKVAILILIIVAIIWLIKHWK